MKYNTFLFDFDGTLVDSMPSYISAMLRILDENGIKYGKDIIKIITPLGYAGTARYYINDLGLNMPEEEIIKAMKVFVYDEYASKIPLKRNVRETLEKLKGMGASLNILTASPHTVLDVCLKRLQVFELFTNVWSCDDFNTTKANKEIYRMAAKALNCKVEDIIFLDDNYNADKTAVEAGMTVCGVYDKSSEDYVADIKSIANYYINDFSELLKIISQN